MVCTNTSMIFYDSKDVIIINRHNMQIFCEKLNSSVKSRSQRQDITTKGSNYCGFSRIIYFVGWRNLQQMREFNKWYPLGFQKSLWTKNRKSVRKYRLKAVSYKNGNKSKEKETVIEHFSKTNYQKLPAEERQAPKLVGCNQCWITHRQQFSLKRNDKSEEQHTAHSK